jgi:hypothetical protein
MTAWSYDGDDLLIRVKVDDDLLIRVKVDDDLLIRVKNCFL